MKRYIVKALIYFDDYEGKEITDNESAKKRKAGDIFQCYKKRYEYLKNKNAVVLMGINKRVG